MKNILCFGFILLSLITLNIQAEEVDKLYEVKFCIKELEEEKVCKSKEIGLTEIHLISLVIEDYEFSVEQLDTTLFKQVVFYNTKHGKDEIMNRMIELPNEHRINSSTFNDFSTLLSFAIKEV